MACSGRIDVEDAGCVLVLHRRLKRHDQRQRQHWVHPILYDTYICYVYNFLPIFEKSFQYFQSVGENPRRLARTNRGGNIFNQHYNAGFHLPKTEACHNMNFFVVISSINEMAQGCHGNAHYSLIGWRIVNDAARCPQNARSTALCDRCHSFLWISTRLPNMRMQR